MSEIINENAALFFVEKHRQGQTSKKVAFIEGTENGRQISFGELGDQSDRMADMLARHGVSREDRAVMLVHDTVEFPVIFWGAIKCGVIPVPLNTMLSPEIYKSILADARPTALFISAPMLDIVAPVIDNHPTIKAVFVVGGADQYLDFAAELNATAPRTLIDVRADEVAFWLYSSGSTGTPKGVRHVHSSLQATADTFGQQVLRITGDDVIFSVAKLFFAYGLGNGISFPMSVGATTVLWPAPPSPDAVFQVMKRTRPTIYCGVPTLYAAMLPEMKGQRPEGSERLRISVSAGEALPAHIGNKWKELMGTDILDGVGSTELLHIFLSNSPDSLEYGTSGVAVPGYKLRLVDDFGNDVKAGEIGELLVDAPSAADGYWNQRQKSRATFAGIWTHTGDKYEQREDGRYIYCGRTDDMFKVSGIWVSPFEVEQALITHPAVLEAAVVSARDSEDLEKPKAFVVLNEGADTEGLAENLKSHVQQTVGKWKYPRWVEVVDELPKTATGKIQRFKLRV